MGLKQVRSLYYQTLTLTLKTRIGSENKFGFQNIFGFVNIFAFEASPFPVVQGLYYLTLTLTLKIRICFENKFGSEVCKGKLPPCKTFKRVFSTRSEASPFPVLPNMVQNIKFNLVCSDIVAPIASCEALSTKPTIIHISRLLSCHFIKHVKLLLKYS